MILSTLSLAILFSFTVAGLVSTYNATPVRCSSVEAPSVPGAQVVSISGVERRNVSVSTLPMASGLNFCDVKVIITHPGANDSVLVEVWLPLDGWNGRFQATGGGGYATGVFDIALGPAVASNYSAASTDGGHSVNPFDPGAPWALTGNGQINWPLLTDFASRSLHDMTVLGKAVTANFYGWSAQYSYWNGCSTGGRQGLMEAQRFPEDFNGILANSPAINWPSFIVAEQWPQIVMDQEQVFPSQCEFDLFTNASIAACDHLDGVVDGVIGDVANCSFDPYTLVGSTIDCNGTMASVTVQMATVVHKILQGPTDASGAQLWYGLNVGTPFAYLPGLGLANVETVNGITTPSPFPVSTAWISYFLEQNPNYDTSTITYSQFPDLFAQSNAEYESVIGTNNPDLSAFRDAGGKMITWHGLADQLIFPGGTIDYREQVNTLMGGTEAVDEFYRLFLAPGVYHCGFGPGPMPTDPLNALVKWVETGLTPETLAAETVNTSGETVTRNICKYPLVSRYKGIGDPNSAMSYSCADSFHKMEG
jgi:hypothetical protein